MKNKQYVLSVSFANYLKGVSGMAKVLMEHQISYNEANVSYVNLFVVKKYLFNENITAFCFYGLIIDGEYKGIFDIFQIIDYVRKWNKQGCVLLDIHIHHLLYVKIKQIDELLSSIQNVPIKLFLHDYYTVCWNYTLLKNNTLYCGDTGLDKSKCIDCEYYQRSNRRVKEIKSLLFKHKDRILAISPSTATRDIWLKSYEEFENQIIVIPHQTEEGQYYGNKELIGDEIRLGFLGMPAEHKGWGIWSKLNKVFGNQYEFCVYNSSKDEYKNMKKYYIKYDANNLDAMTNALRETQVNAVLLWAKWPETYSYTFYESIAANAFILTNKLSGNITRQVIDRKCGMIFDSEKDLFTFLSNKENVKNVLNEYRESEHFVPDRLIKNTKIVNCSKNSYPEQRVCRKRIRFHNYALLIILRILYRLDKIPG